MLCLGLGWVRGVRSAIPVYSATAEMALVMDSGPGLELPGLGAGFSGDSATYDTELAVVTSGELMGRLADELGLVDDPEFNSFLEVPGA